MNVPDAQMFDDKAVEYTKNLDYIILYGTPANVLSLMWAAWIYAKVLHEVCKDDEKPLWQRAAEQLYNSMEVFYDESGHKCFGDNNSLLSIADDAVNTMKGYIAEKDPTAKKTQVQQSAPVTERPAPANDDSAQLQARIAEIEAENASLEKQLEEEKLKNQGIEVLGAGNDEWIVELLAHLCYGDEQIARDILDEIRGKEDPVIADIIFERKQKNKISPKTQNRELWKILHAAKLYRGIEGNFNTALRRRQQR